MPIKLADLLPEEISDETAYHLVNFIVELGDALESHYYAKVKQHIKDNVPSDMPAGWLED